MSRNYSKADQKLLRKLHQKRDPIPTKIQSKVPSSRMQTATRSLQMLQKVLPADKCENLKQTFESMQENYTNKCQLEKLMGKPITSTSRPKPYFRTLQASLKDFMLYINYTQQQKR